MSDGNEIRQHIDDLEAELRSETALAPLEETLSSIVSALPDIVYRLDAEGKIVFISDAIRDYGYDPSALVGRSMLDLVHPADRNRAEHRINERRTGGRSTRSLELRLTTADSEAVSFELNETTTDGEADGAGGAGGDPGATLLVDAEGVYASQDPQADTFQYTQGVARDITQRKLLDEALDQARQAMLERMATHSEQIGAAYDQLKEGLGEAAASEERYRSLVENLPVGVTHTTLYGAVLYQNPYARAMLGYTVEELSQVKAEDLYANPQDRAELLRTLAEREVHSFEYEMRRKGGRTIWVRGTTRVIKDEHGMPIEYHSFIEDVTDRRLMEQEYVRLEEQLRQAQKMEAVGQITAGIAHNFNNLLQGITGNLQLALLDAPEELKRLLEDADEVTGRAAEMVHQLMIFSRQGLQPSNKTISIWPVVSTTIEMCRRTFDKRIELVAVEPEFEAKVSGDEGLLQQVLLNLCINARDALNAGATKGASIRIDVEEVVVDAEQASSHTGARSGPHLRLNVTDNGVGMDQATIKRIFDPFFTTKGVGEGTGLGLATVYGIVTEHKGWVECHSEPGEGTTFSILLPAISDGELDEERLQDEPMHDAAVQPVTILVVDDEDVVRTSTARLLQRRGYDVLEAVDGYQALEVFRQQTDQIGCILLDLNMPGMSGLEVLAEVTALKPSVKVLILTGYAARIEEVSGATAVLQKPFSVDELRKKLAEVLNGA